MKQLSSILRHHYNDLMEIKTLDQLKEQSNKIVSSSKINPIDKKKFLLEIDASETMRSLQFFLTNSMLKYEGMGIRKL